MNCIELLEVKPLRLSCRRRAVAIVALMPALCWLTAPSAVGQTVTTYGTLSNFDAINDTGHECHGFEIELEDILPEDVVCTFGDSGDPANPYNRYGGPAIVPTATGVIVRYASGYDPVNHLWAATTPLAVSPYPPTIGHQCWSLGDPNYPSSGCEHFGVCLTRNATKTTYRWLIEDSANPGTLTTFGSGVSIPAPVWDVVPQPPPAPGLPPPPPLVIAVIPAPPPPPVPPGGVGQWGEAIWVKIYTTEIPEPVEIEDLVPGGAGMPDPEVEPPEIEWKLLQSPPEGQNSENEESANGGEAGVEAEAVSRLYEFYKYTGEYDPENNEATCNNPLEGDPRCGPADPETGVAGVGDLIGIQNAAVNLFDESISFTKSADKQTASVGDTVNYTLTLSNTSTPGSPDLECTLLDTQLGLDEMVMVAAGSSDVTEIAYVIAADDADPLINEAEVACSPVGFPDVLTASSSWTVDLVPPPEPPVLSCANMFVTAEAGFCSAVAAYELEVTPPDVPVVCDPPSGSTLQAGDTGVTCSASNPAGTAECSFTVAVYANPPDCADLDVCTEDACFAGVCEHQPIGGCCHWDGECEDGEACTFDVCVEHACVHEPIVPCCNVDVECDDLDECTIDACVNHLCQNSAQPGCCTTDAECVDDNPCTMDVCVAHACEHQPIAGCCLTDADCDDGLFCNGQERCTDLVCRKAHRRPCPPPFCDEVNDVCRGKEHTKLMRQDAPERHR